MITISEHPSSLLCLVTSSPMFHLFTNQAQSLRTFFHFKEFRREYCSTVHTAKKLYFKLKVVRDASNKFQGWNAVDSNREVLGLCKSTALVGDRNILFSIQRRHQRNCVRSVGTYACTSRATLQIIATSVVFQNCDVISSERMFCPIPTVILTSLPTRKRRQGNSEGALVELYIGLQLDGLPTYRYR